MTSGVDVDAMSMRDLQTALRARGQSLDGRKADLQERLRVSLGATTETAPAAPVTIQGMGVR